MAIVTSSINLVRASPGDADVPTAPPAVPGMPEVVPGDAPEGTCCDAAYLAAAAEAAVAAASVDPAAKAMNSGAMAITQFAKECSHGCCSRSVSNKALPHSGR